jgi:hypothetical protein
MRELSLLTMLMSLVFGEKPSYYYHDWKQECVKNVICLLQWNYSEGSLQNSVEQMLV